MSPAQSPARPPRAGAAPAWGAPFPHACLPPPESWGTKVRIRLVAGLAVLASAVYLGWRALATVDLDAWWIAVPLLLLEVYALFSFLLHLTGLWDLDAVRPPPPVERTELRLAVLLSTCDESAEVLLPAIAAAVAVRLPHETWVLDDGARPEVARLAEQLGARCLTRTDRRHAKAGNVNHALRHVDADVVALLDADHVASEDLFVNTLGHFDDSRVALVQTPQDFYNLDSFEHAGSRWTPTSAEYRFTEQGLFYRRLQAGRNRWNAAFCCGTGVLFRTAALREVGGLATETVAEDIHTSIRLHRRGWRSVYHNEVLARGLAAADASQYLAQRLRWGTGAMQVLRTENPAWVGGLRPMQRVSYLATLLGWFESWRTLGYLLAPMVVLLTGAVPVRASWEVFLLWFAPAFLLQRWALRLLARGTAPQGVSTVFDLVRLPATLRATLRLVSDGERGFDMTAKGRAGGSRQRVPLPTLHTALVLASGVSAAWFAATSAGLTPVHYAVPWAANGAAVWLAVNSALLLAAVRRIQQERYGAERRGAVRFPVQGHVLVGTTPGRLLDASLNGFRVVLPTRVARTSCEVTIDIGGGPVEVRCLVRSQVERVLRDGARETVVGLAAVPGQVAAQGVLSRALLQTSSRSGSPVALPAQRRPGSASVPGAGEERGGRADSVHPCPRTRSSST